jgi:hypothetical protein
MSKRIFCKSTFIMRPILQEDYKTFHWENEVEVTIRIWAPDKYSWTWSPKAATIIIAVTFQGTLYNTCIFHIQPKLDLLLNNNKELKQVPRLEANNHRSFHMARRRWCRQWNGTHDSTRQHQPMQQQIGELEL